MSLLPERGAVSASPGPDDDSSPGDDLTVSVDWSGPAVVLRVSGEIDMTTAGRLEDAVNLALTNNPQRLVLDLTGVGFFSSAGITPLIAAQEATRGRTRFAVVITGDPVFRSLKLTGVDCDLAIYASVEDALAG